jgi:hypothetical protein
MSKDKSKSKSKSKPDEGKGNVAVRRTQLRKHKRESWNYNAMLANQEAHLDGRPTRAETARMLREERREPICRAFAAWPLSTKSYASWLSSKERTAALEAGERIREAQRMRKTCAPD